MTAWKLLWGGSDGPPDAGSPFTCAGHDGAPE